jgi:hypothetical protein
VVQERCVKRAMNGWVVDSESGRSRAGVIEG